jgi:hypothetical protein
MLKVFTSRYWHNPKIGVWVTEKGIGVEIAFDDFMKALCEEMKPEVEVIRQGIGSVTLTLTQAQFDKKFDTAISGFDTQLKSAAARVIKKKKEVTAQAVASRMED